MLHLLPSKPVKHKIIILVFRFVTFKVLFGSLGGLDTLLCALKLKIELEIQVNELLKMFNNSNKRHSLRKSG